ncbi:MAG TPA: arginine N-succinyltransferase [Bacteriovoracaceae bacterium]|nr:arginine N-succinyltransferase [Bacteriovoracaceae bacterium]
MYVLRSVKPSDLAELFHLSNIMTFINLPPDEDIISAKIESSMKSFKDPSPNLWENYYIFVLEDTHTHKILGVSMIHAQHGTEDEPHFFLTVGQEAKFSQTINTGFVHGTLKLGLDTDGPTEIGGLILDPDFRGHEQKLGKQISFVRFLYMAIHPERFKEYVHSELMPPFDKYGNSPLWEAIGRRFLNMNYHEADVLSRSNKEFILSLFPSENIYQTLLPIEAREAIGKVGKETEPVQRMLEKIGFKYMYEVDPFDGGPHYRAPLKEIKPIKEKITGTLSPIEEFKADKDTLDVIVALNHPEHDFFAIRTHLKKLGSNNYGVDKNLMDELGVKPDSNFTAIPF